jgi:hypothetical protein
MHRSKTPRRPSTGHPSSRTSSARTASAATAACAGLNQRLIYAMRDDECREPRCFSHITWRRISLTSPSTSLCPCLVTPPPRLARAMLYPPCTQGALLLPLWCVACASSLWSQQRKLARLPSSTSPSSLRLPPSRRSCRCSTGRRRRTCQRLEELFGYPGTNAEEATTVYVGCISVLLLAENKAWSGEVTGSVGCLPRSRGARMGARAGRRQAPSSWHWATGGATQGPNRAVARP